jgi:copper chaperone CopZ
MSESTTLIAPATAARKTTVEPLFEPVRLGRYDLPHRMVMAPLTRSRARQPGNVPSPLNACYYAQRASAALIVTEATQGRPRGYQTSLHLLSRRSAMIYDPTGQHLTKLFVKETSMSSLFSNPKNPAAFSIRVEGMACDSCVERVEKAIRATPGVVSASVNLATKRAEVTFSGVPDIAAVIAAVGVAGYECMVENASSSNLS